MKAVFSIIFSLKFSNPAFSCFLKLKSMDVGGPVFNIFKDFLTNH